MPPAWKIKRMRGDPRMLRSLEVLSDFAVLNDMGSMHGDINIDKVVRHDGHLYAVYHKPGDRKQWSVGWYQVGMWQT